MFSGFDSGHVPQGKRQLCLGEGQHLACGNNCIAIALTGGGVFDLIVLAGLPRCGLRSTLNLKVLVAMWTVD